MNVTNPAAIARFDTRGPVTPPLATAPMHVPPQEPAA